jgi:replicative DNA helicase
VAYNNSPPHDPDLEACIIQSVIEDPSLLPIITAVITPEDFCFPRHYEYWRAILGVAAQGLPIHEKFVVAHLKSTGRYEQAGGAEGYANIILATANSQHAESYAVQVRKFAVTRRIIQAAQRVLSAGYAEDINHDAFANDSRSDIGAACDCAVIERSAPRKLDAEFLRIYADIERGTDPEGMVSTGIPAIDTGIGGLWPGLVHLIAARPSMGKSCLGLNIGTNAALAGKKVLMFSMEDIAYFLAIRQLGRFSDVDTQLITQRKVPQGEFKKILQGITKCSGIPLWVDDSGSLSTAQIRAKVLRHRDKEGLDLLVIDHLAEITERGEGETQIVSRAMQGVRDLTKELGVPTLLLHQLNRKVEDRVSKLPMLSDLKQSGKVEEAARMVGFMCRPGYYSGDESRHELQFYVAKANHGRSGVVKLWCDLSRMFIRGWDPQTDGEFISDTTPQGLSKGGQPERQSKPTQNQWREPDWNDR